MPLRRLYQSFLIVWTGVCSMEVMARGTCNDFFIYWPLVGVSKGVVARGRWFLGF